MRNDNFIWAGVILPIIMWAGFIIVWFVNAIKLLNCDFQGPWKEEIIHGIGVFVPPLSILTVWF